MSALREFSMPNEQHITSGIVEKTKNDSEISTIKSSNNVDSNLEYVFGWNRFNLSLVGLWPDNFAKKNQSFTIMRYRPPILSLWLFSFFTAPQFSALIAYTFVLTDIIDILNGIVGFLALIMRIIVLWSNGEVLAWCLLCVTEDWTQKHSSIEREFMMKYAMLGRRITIGFCILVYSLMWSYIIVKSVPLLNLHLDVENATIADIGNKLFSPSYFPFDLSKLSNFALAWIGQFIGVIFSTIAYSSSDCFIAVLIIHLCGQITILRHKLVNLTDHETSLSAESIRSKFTNFVKRHNKLARLATVIKNAVNITLLVMVLSCAMQLGLQLFSLLIALTERKTGQFPLFHVIYIVSYFNVTMIHLFLYCYVGEMLIQESESLGLASYSCEWYNLSSKNAKDLILVMHRAKAPFQIWAGKFVPLSLELFGNVLKTSLGYFSMLLTIMEQTAE